jgi:hypothetical protein
LARVGDVPPGFENRDDHDERSREERPSRS